MWHVILCDLLRSNNSGRLKGNTKCQGCQELLKLIKEILCVIPIHIPWQNTHEQQHREESFLLTDSSLDFSHPLWNMMAQYMVYGRQSICLLLLTLLWSRKQMLHTRPWHEILYSCQYNLWWPTTVNQALQLKSFQNFLIQEQPINWHSYPEHQIIIKKTLPKIV